ncbi:MAG: hypothetical protein N0E56_15915 [Candidatus Thiodiazotropha endolucinida]|nr:hypothetical protein [Candidatus Thiodiazotropha taylori]MCW4268110.1 hypothetical protein [Candidatus Thiodiazotropha endolucinida]
MWWASDVRPEFSHLYIDGYSLPKRGVSRHEMDLCYFEGQAEWGDVAKLIYDPEQDEWLICKNCLDEFGFTVPGITDQQAVIIGKLLGIECLHPNWLSSEETTVMPSSRYWWDMIIQS